jgi:ribonuclease G
MIAEPTASLLFNIAPGEVRVARVREGRLCDLVIDRQGTKSLLGNIYLGRVSRVLPRLEAAFVDIGEEPAAFLRLRLKDVRGREARDLPRTGDAILLQIEREAEGEKGPRATRSISLAGPYLVYTPRQPGIRISRRIASVEERQRLEALMADIAEPDDGFILRTQAASADEASLRADAKRTKERWKKIVERADALLPPALIEAELPPVPREIRDQADAGIARIVIDDKRALAEAKRYCESFYAAAAGRLELHSGPEPLFELHEVESEIERALRPRVPLPSGGEIVIEEGETLTAIDVNTRGASGEGSRGGAILATNLEAAAEIARQIRLRNIAGAILIDFIGMKRDEERQKVADAFAQAAADDPAAVQLRGFTRLGFAEVTRRRMRNSLDRQLRQSCPACGGSGRTKRPLALAFEALRRARAEANGATRNHLGGRLVLLAAPALIAALEGEVRNALRAFEEETGLTLVLETQDDWPVERYEFITRL